MPKLKLTVVTPVFNEEQVIGHFHKRTRNVLDSMEDVEATILFVVDRSTGGCKKFCVNRHFAGNCNFQKWNKNDYTIIIT